MKVTGLLDVENFILIKEVIFHFSFHFEKCVWVLPVTVSQ